MLCSSGACVSGRPRFVKHRRVKLASAVAFYMPAQAPRHQANFQSSSSILICHYRKRVLPLVLRLFRSCCVAAASGLHIACTERYARTHTCTHARTLIQLHSTSRSYSLLQSAASCQIMHVKSRSSNEIECLGR